MSRWLYYSSKTALFVDGQDSWTWKNQKQSNDYDTENSGLLTDWRFLMDEEKWASIQHRKTARGLSEINAKCEICGKLRGRHLPDEVKECKRLMNN